MAPITHSIEIARPPEAVFDYVNQLDRHSEWQADIVSSKLETPGPVGVGSRASDTRKTPVGTQTVTYEVTEHDPPRRAAFRGVDGPVRPLGSVTIEPVGEAGSRLTLELDLQGHGLLGLIVAPLARSQARKQVPQDQQRLKERLEAGA
jgi:uncharacterized membrane protein